MKISTILDHVDSEQMGLPQFQRGYVWTREQVRSLFDSLYHKYPVGSLLLWRPPASQQMRGDLTFRPSVAMLLDGQQRVTSLYAVLRGKVPPFFDGDPRLLEGLRFNLRDETFEFYQPVKMRNDSLWCSVTALAGEGDLTNFLPDPSVQDVKVSVARLGRVLQIFDHDMPAEELPANLALDTVVNIFNRVNSGGTKLSSGDLALATATSRDPGLRAHMRDALATWRQAGYEFDMVWLLRCINTVVTGRSQFQHLERLNADTVRASFHTAVKHVDTVLNAINLQLGLGHDQVLFGRYAIPVMVRYLERRSAALTTVDRERLLGWYVIAAMRGRFSGSTETVMDQDLATIDGMPDPFPTLLEHLRRSQGRLRVDASDFGYTAGSRFYSVLYLLTRVHGALDWGNGLPLKVGLLGKLSRLEVHHIFPKALLRDHGVNKNEMNAVANFCLVTQAANLKIGKQEPANYFDAIERAHPGALASQWIPLDRELWQVRNYSLFLEARRRLLAGAANQVLVGLLHDDGALLEDESRGLSGYPDVVTEGDADLGALNLRLAEFGLAQGAVEYSLEHPDTHEQVGVLDLAWPDGLQPGLTAPVAIAIGADMATMVVANRLGFRCFSDVHAFQAYVDSEVLVATSTGGGS